MDILQLMPRQKREAYSQAAKRRWENESYRQRIIESKRAKGTEHMREGSCSPEANRQRSLTQKRNHQLRKQEAA